MGRVHKMHEICRNDNRNIVRLYDSIQKIQEKIRKMNGVNQ